MPRDARNEIIFSMYSLPQLKNWFENTRNSLIQDYFRFLRFKSISADPHYAKEVIACADWLVAYMQKYTGMQVEKIPTMKYPIVYAQDLRAGANAPTILIYGHYDVQPVDPLDQWHSDPFEPTLKEGKVYARGAVDDKGQIFYAILAMRAWFELGRQLPINVKFCIEGEEESASMGLSSALSQLKDKLRSDSILVVDFDQFDEQTPAISLGARGIVSLEVTLKGSSTDLHSGIHGGLAYNPNKAMVQLLAEMWDEKGRIVVPGFYDDVLEMDASSFSFRYDEKTYMQTFGITALGGEEGRSLQDNNWFRPTIEINGVHGGYGGAGVKTVIPAECMAKISCRLVPNQDPKNVSHKIAQFLKRKVPKNMEIKIIEHGGEPAFRGKADSFLAKAVSVAATEVTGKQCVSMLAGGSIPIIGAMMRELNAEPIGMGFGLATDQIHAPNEHFDLERLKKGFLTVARVLELL